MAKIIRPGTEVRYRTASGRIRHAIVTAVTSQTVVNLRVGNGSTATKASSVGRVNSRDGGGAGFVRRV